MLAQLEGKIPLKAFRRNDRSFDFLKGEKMGENFPSVNSVTYGVSYEPFFWV